MIPFCLLSLLKLDGLSLFLEVSLQSSISFLNAVIRFSRFMQAIIFPKKFLELSFSFSIH